MTETERHRYVDLIRQAARPGPPEEVDPLPEQLQRRRYPEAVGPLDGVRGVLFDVYGTLFASAAGDIGVTTEYLRGDLESVAREFTEDSSGEELKAWFRAAVQARHAAAYERTPYPEIRVEELWSALPGRRPGTDPAELALRYELALNPVAPLPGARECLLALASGGLELGIISNAQFYTPLLFDAYFGADPAGLGFSADLLIYSCDRGAAKPAPYLFQVALEAIDRRSRQARDWVYVGNDMLNDVYAAGAAGFRTVLFAGDRRSLRLRREIPFCADLAPDAVIRRLADLPDLLGLG